MKIKNELKKIQTAGYNGARTVLKRTYSMEIQNFVIPTLVRKKKYGAILSTDMNFGNLIQNFMEI